MLIHQVRLGHATSSSSVHNIVLLDDGAAAEDADIDDGDYYGWQPFVLASHSEKAKYLAAQLYLCLREMGQSERIARIVAREMTGVNVAADVVIDHQSTWALPRVWDASADVDSAFWTDLQAAVLADRAVIVGGNDNDPDEHAKTTLQGHIARAPTFDDTHAVVRARKDSRGYWTIFNAGSGAKIRLSFPSFAHVNVDGADAPELVDVKITNACAAACAHCYQDSRPDGAHASSGTLWPVVGALHDMRVFEVVVGGGEPTAHPHLGEFLSSLRAHGIAPSFTTRSIDWIHDPQRRTAYLDPCTAWGFSATNAADVARVANAVAYYGCRPPTIHYVMGAARLPDLYTVAVACNQHRLDLLLLGWKTCGRAGAKPHEYNGWVKTVKSADLWRVGIDTVLAAESREALAGVDDFWYEVKEGQFSMYLDAVDGRAGPSSYGETSPAEMTPAGIQAAWKRLREGSPGADGDPAP